MANSFDIPDAAFDGLSALVQLGPSALHELVKEVKGLRPTLDLSGLAGRLARDPPAAALLEDAISSVLIPLSGLRSEFRMPVHEFVELLTDLIEEQNADWFKANRDRWESVSPTVEELIGPDGFFCQMNKVHRLLMNRPALAENVKLTAELRPVFNEEATAVSAYLITSTMTVQYSEFGRTKKLHVTLDLEDLQRLQEQVDRELRKIQLIERQVSMLEVPSLVAGAKRNERRV